MNKVHLAEREARRHDEYQRAEISSLRADLANTQQRLDAVVRRLGIIEDRLGIEPN